jgi:hypothetical protein
VGADDAERGHLLRSVFRAFEVDRADGRRRVLRPGVDALGEDLKLPRHAVGGERVERRDVGELRVRRGDPPVRQLAPNRVEEDRQPRQRRNDRDDPADRHGEELLQEVAAGGLVRI